MKLKVNTQTHLTEEQRRELQALGCDPAPFITREDTLIFAANCTQEEMQALSALPYVTTIEPMPVYRLM
ncbi:MAG TPA: hypothetical protein VHL10_05230 [Nitrososphaera sp.]|nr:hypothetical protein [Nitrososphaera sp.]